MPTNDACAFCAPIWSDAGVLYTPTSSGGSFVAALPVANVHDERLERAARTTDATLASTQFETDLKTARAIGGLAVIVANASPDAQVRYRVSNSAGSFGSPVYDSGWSRIFPAGLTVEKIAGVVPLHTHIPDTSQTGRYVLTEVDDTANADGYLDLARVVIAGAWRPSSETGISVGAKIGRRNRTVSTDTGGGAKFHNARRAPVTYAITTPQMREVEAFDDADEIERRLGTSGQLVFVLDPTDTVRGWKKNIFCTLTELTGLEWAQYDAIGKVWALEQVL